MHLKVFKLSNQERYEHVGPKSLVHKVEKIAGWRKEIMLGDDLKAFKITSNTAANKEKTSKEADAALKVNSLNFCKEHYEDILPVIMDKIHRDKRKEVSSRAIFRKG
nr:hypothetical protein [Tanacetum cinerariifolium]